MIRAMWTAATGMTIDALHDCSKGIDSNPLTLLDTMRRIDAGLAKDRLAVKPQLQQIFVYIG